MQSPIYNPDALIQSPLYDPKTPESPGNESPIDEEPTISNNFIQNINTRKRIYGEEYKISTYLNVDPIKNPKILKLKQPIFEMNSNATTYRTEYSTEIVNCLKNNVQKMDCAGSDDDQDTIIDDDDDTYNDTLITPIIQGCSIDNDGDDANNNNNNNNNNDDEEEDADDDTLLKNLNDFSPQFSMPIPSITKRPFVNFILNKNDIPKLCNRCFAIECVCKYLENKSYT